MTDLYVIVPSIRGEGAIATLRSAMAQQGFQHVRVLLCGKSAYREEVGSLCRRENLAVEMVADRPEPDVILPGAARNAGIDKLESSFDCRPEDCVLFLDDDIVIPAEYANTLLDYLHACSPMLAAIGRVKSMPKNLPVQIIDYSNFYYLQTEKSITDLPWMVSTATLVRWGSIQKLRFPEELRIGEDVAFFDKVRSAAGSFGVCSKTTAFHFHDRNSFMKAMHYQYQNGRHHTGWHTRDGFHILRLIRRVIRTFRKSFIANLFMLMKHPILSLGVLVSFIVLFTGSEMGSRALRKSQ